jgi:hypothetical protein
VRTTEQRLVDAACVLVLTALALFGFDETFSSRVYLAVGITGAVVVVLVAICVSGAAGPRTAVFALVAFVLYVPVGAVAAFRSFRDGRLPSGDELSDVLTSTITGTEELLTTIPPLDPIGSVMVLPYALGYLGAGTSVWLAFRTRRPIAPVLPLLVVLAVVVLLGPLQYGERTLAIAVAFAAVAFWWASYRAGDPASRSTEIRHATRGRASRAVAVGLVIGVAVTVVTQLVPVGSLDGDRVVLRGRIGSGATVDEFDNPLSGFRRYTQGSADSVFDKTLFVVRGLEQETSLRFVTLDDYDGTAWRAGNRTVADAEDDLYQRIGSEVAAPRPGTPIEVNVEMRQSYTGAWLPLAGQLTSIDFDFADGEAQRDDVRYNPATGSAFVVGGIGPGDDYTFGASVPTTKLARNSEAYPVDEPLQPEGQKLDEYLAPYARSGRDPLTQVLLLARYLQRNGRYSDGTGAVVVPPGHDINRLASQFIGGRRIVGNDEQYAAFMALAANRLRVPARVVVGAFAGNGKVQGRDVLAWVELRVRDGSWRVLPTSTFMSNRRPSNDDEPPQSLEEFIQDQVSQDDTENPESPEQVPLPDDDADLGDQQDEEEATGSTVPGGRIPVTVLLLGLVLWLVPLLKLVRRLVRQRAGRPSARVAGAWRELVDLGLDLRVAVPAGATREGQAAALGLGPELAQHGDDLVFAPLPPDAAEAERYWGAVDRARTEVGRQHPRWRRYRALFNPASLVRSVRGLADRRRPVRRPGWRPLRRPGRA